MVEAPHAQHEVVGIEVSWEIFDGERQPCKTRVDTKKLRGPTHREHVTGNDNDQKEPSITVCSGAQSQHPARLYDDPCNAYHNVHQQCPKQKGLDRHKLINVAQQALHAVIQARTQRGKPGIHEVHGDKRGKQNPSACLKFFNTLEFLLPVYCIDVSQRQDVTPNYAALQKNPLKKSIEEA